MPATWAVFRPGDSKSPRDKGPRALLTNLLRSISPDVPTAALRQGLLRYARHSLLLQGVSARRLTCGFARAGKTKAQGVEAECQKGGEIQLTGLRNHVLRFLEVFEGRLGVGAPFAVDAYGTVSPVLQCLLDLTHLACAQVLRRNLIIRQSLR